MRKRKHPANTAADARALRRLIDALNEPGATARRDPLDATMVVVAATRDGVTLPRARVSAAVAETALARGLARWDGEGAARRLLPTAEARAHSRRSAATADCDPFRAQHTELTRRNEDGAAVIVNEGESPLAWLARRKDRGGETFLGPELIEAGERFRRDATQAQILQRVTADWDAAGGARPGAPRMTVGETAIDARRRLARAFDAVGPELAGLITDVCGYLKGLELIESERGWPRRSAKVVLKIALERLARHYGLAREARGLARAGGVLHWGAEDYRPRIDAS